MSKIEERESSMLQLDPQGWQSAWRIPALAPTIRKVSLHVWHLVCDRCDPEILPSPTLAARFQRKSGYIHRTCYKPTLWWAGEGWSELQGDHWWHSKDWTCVVGNNTGESNGYKWLKIEINAVKTNAGSLFPLLVNMITWWKILQAWH